MIYFKLDDLLKQLNYSRTRFANMCGVRPNTINDMCNGITKRLELETLNAILKCLNEISEKELNINDLMQYRENGEFKT